MIFGASSGTTVQEVSGRAFLEAELWLFRGWATVGPVMRLALRAVGFPCFRMLLLPRSFGPAGD